MATSPAIGLTLIDSKDVTLDNVLGEGGFGTVYRATHVNWGRVAVKRLINFRMTDSHQKEAEKMLRSLTSPYLVRIMGLIEHSNGVDIVMEFFENGSLKEFEEKYMRCDCWARKIKMIQDIAYGMNFLHTLNPPITHCDLKLENVFVGNGFVAKIGDFGLAVSSTKSRQKAGSAGTISHMPPEAFESSNVEPDEAWDIYTFGLTAYELTTGRDPWPQLNTFANETLVSVWVGKGHRPNLDVIPSDAPREIVEIITSCWAAEPKERPRFINVLKTVTELFETKYERSLRKADRAISDQMDEVQESTERKAQSVDSGWGSLEAWTPKEKPNQTEAPQIETAAPQNETATPPTESNSTDRDKKGLAIKNEDNNDVLENQPGPSEDAQSASAEEGNLSSDTAGGISGATGGLGSLELLSLEGDNVINNDEYEDYTAEVQTDKDLTWKYKHSIENLRSVYSCRWIDDKHLAVCMKGCVRVYAVNASSSQLAYTVTSKKWKPLIGQAKEVRGVAVSESLPDHMYVICDEQPYVYQFLRREASQEKKRYKIPSDIKNPYAIAANANVAVISAYVRKYAIVCNLPEFTHPRTVQIGFPIHDVSVNSDYLVLLGDSKILVRCPTGSNMTKNITGIQQPVNCEKFHSVCIGNTNNGVTELYVGWQDFENRQSVSKYTFEENKGAGEVPSKCIGRVIGGFRFMHDKCLALSSDQTMALGLTFVKKVKFYKLE